jgi:hypothetical protein
MIAPPDWIPLRAELFSLALSLGLLAIPSCRLPHDPTAEPLVSNFRFQPEAFDSFTGSTSLRYKLARQATTTLRIVSSSKGSEVFTLFEELKESGGTHEHTWLGDMEEGYFAPSGSYVGILEVEGDRYEAVVRVYHR